MRNVGPAATAADVQRKTVAVDINPATRAVLTGTEVFTREVCSRLPGAAGEIRWRFIASRPGRDLGVDTLVAPLPRLWTQARLPALLARERPDLLFVPGHAIPFAWPGRTVTVVHDLAFERHPAAYAAAARTYLRLTTRWAAARCPILIAISEATRKDLVQLYGVPGERIRVVPLGVSQPAVDPAPLSRLKDLGVDGTFVLQVGRIEARKNQATALEAASKLDGVTLVVAGPESDPALAARLRASDRCRVLGAVDQPTLELLYQRAGAVVVPSLYEGFGLPVLEAMARGKVVVAARTSSLPEVAGDAAVYYERPTHADELAAAMRTALTDQSVRLPLMKAARERARRFTWERTAAGVAAAIREAVAL